MAREHDPGDAVPPGVAPQTPVPITPADQAVLHKLEELGPQTRRDPDAKTATSPTPTSTEGQSGEGI